MLNHEDRGECFSSTARTIRSGKIHAPLTNQSRRGRNMDRGPVHTPNASVPSARPRFNLGARIRHPSDGAHGAERAIDAELDPTEASTDV